MIFRTYDETIMYVIEAPEEAQFYLDEEGSGELIFFERMTNGTSIERRLPTSVVLRAALRNSCGLRVLECRRPLPHPETTVRRVPK